MCAFGAVYLYAYLLRPSSDNIRCVAKQQAPLLRKNYPQLQIFYEHGAWHGFYEKEVRDPMSKYGSYLWEEVRAFDAACVSSGM
jgi:hypothetical protein